MPTKDYPYYPPELIKRVNKKNSQANFYLKSGFGFLYSDFKENDKKKRICYKD